MTRPIKHVLLKNRGLLGIAIAGVAVALAFLPSSTIGIFLPSDNALAQQGGPRCASTYEVCTTNSNTDENNPSKGNPHNVNDNGQSYKGNAHKI
jgi:hypothetical protein